MIYIKKSLLSPIIEKKVGQITDLKYGNYIYSRYSYQCREKKSLDSLEDHVKKMIFIANRDNIPQIQIRFPTKWLKFTTSLVNHKFRRGLFFLEKKITRKKMIISNGFCDIKDIYIIRDQILKQQKFHYKLNTDFFCEPTSFETDNYLNEIQNAIKIGFAISYGVMDEYQKIKGFIVLENDFISELYVDDQMRGKGIGTLLMNSVEKYALNKKMDMINTSLSAQNTQALNFYIKNNFYQTDSLFYYNTV